MQQPIANACCNGPTMRSDADGGLPCCPAARSFRCRQPHACPGRDARAVGPGAREALAEPWAGTPRWAFSRPRLRGRSCGKNQGAPCLRPVGPSPSRNCPQRQAPAASIPNCVASGDTVRVASGSVQLCPCSGAARLRLRHVVRACTGPSKRLGLGRTAGPVPPAGPGALAPWPQSTSSS